MKNKNIYLVALGVISLYTGSFIGQVAQPASPTPAPATAAANPSQEALDRLKANIGIIKTQATILAPKLQEIAAAASQGGIRGFFSAISSASDATTRNAIMELTKTTVTTLNDVNTLKSTGGSSKATAQAALASLAQDPQIKDLIDKVKSIPIIGSTLSTKLQELIGASSAL